MFLSLAISHTLCLYKSLQRDPSCELKCAGSGDLRTGFSRPSSVWKSALSCLTRPVWKGCLRSKGVREKQLSLTLAGAFSPSQSSYRNRWGMGGTFYICDPCVLIFSFGMQNFPQKVSCELAYFKNCNLWGEGVLWQHYITEASRCWVIIIFRQLHAFFGWSKNSPWVWTLQKVTSVKILSPLSIRNAMPS